MMAIPFDHVQMVRSWVTFDEVVTARNTVLVPVEIANTLKRPNAYARLIEVFNANQNIQHGLRRNARDCGAADMLNLKDVVAHGVDDACLLERKLFSPCLVGIEQPNLTTWQA